LGAVTLRPLRASDWKSLREIRLGALRTEPGVFLSTFDLESMKSDEEWRSLAEGDERHQLFGLFDGQTLAGITAVFTDRDDPTGETALLAMSYISPKFRGQGFSRMFYQARLEWARAKPQFVRVRVSHRRSNETSRRANQRFDFRETGTLETFWPDATTEDAILYELPIER
jgi:RimJ/RimL family protein N-acetyltransferase